MERNEVYYHTNRNDYRKILRIEDGIVYFRHCDEHGAVMDEASLYGVSLGAAFAFVSRGVWKLVK